MTIPETAEISFPCPSCAHRLKAQANRAGERVGCPACRKPLTIPHWAMPPQKPPVAETPPIEPIAQSAPAATNRIYSAARLIGSIAVGFAFAGAWLIGIYLVLSSYGILGLIACVVCGLACAVVAHIRKIGFEGPWFLCGVGFTLLAVVAVALSEPRHPLTGSPQPQ